MNVTQGEFDDTIGTLTLNPMASSHTSSIKVKGANQITVQVKNTDSTSVDIEFFGELGLGMCNQSMGIMNLEANSSDVWFSNSGYYYLYLVFTNYGTVPTTVSYLVSVQK